MDRRIEGWTGEGERKDSYLHPRQLLYKSSPEGRKRKQKAKQQPQLMHAQSNQETARKVFERGSKRGHEGEEEVERAVKNSTQFHLQSAGDQSSE